jgi:hypothetical protein
MGGVCIKGYAGAAEVHIGHYLQGLARLAQQQLPHPPPHPPPCPPLTSHADPLALAPPPSHAPPLKRTSCAACALISTSPATLTPSQAALFSHHTRPTSLPLTPTPPHTH